MEDPPGSNTDSCLGLRVVALDQVLRFLATRPAQGRGLPERPPEWRRLVASCVLCLLERRDFVHASGRFYDELDRNLAMGVVAPEDLSEAMDSLLRACRAAPCPGRRGLPVDATAPALPSDLDRSPKREA